MKNCVDCGLTKTLDEYYWDKTVGRHKGYCMVCARERSRKYARTEAGKKVDYEKNKRMYYKYNHKKRAGAKLKYAVKIGTVVKPSNCEGCGANRKLQGHHEDYNKALDVVWLCDPCHKARHGRLRDLTLLTTQEQVKE